ncbi:NO-inducible flavohemoprotein [Sinorhizobium meliloti]|uniref:NO-inducible flavohemoprotein n=1 Tax=Rhizobium meliloti TaxID=382 RepID=UPI000FD613CF|nr:NO-inducible flavohemoprotein [Sinorhizobium meliloti]MDW9416370.1 NO-inducible flavohemoprotein [Sinorhizobium meliloti]MDW9513317.1 NO-inducible flavohemoprotein [Sinorhizobium meliloti]MDW9637400.1 NO-inducible flavohemoprotein [Sinorhizobium meliloti]MDW9669782.1 NO-inducible flavohemoprotein [Sinorhizobium meliloti]MDW9808700.1 NO-inducible flavohemoprotein [Sinorhizobium meliloti]
MSRQLSAETIELVKQSVPALEAHGSDITKAMYARLFRDEHIKSLFNHANQGEGGSQVHALAAAILGYAKNIENLSALGPVIERIAHKHIGYHILPEHYPYVAEALLAAIQDILGDAATPALLNAWGEAYWFLADILKERESDLRADIESRSGGWNGWRRFTIAEKIRESDVVTSFILRPSDGGRVIRHRPGQYLTFRLPLSDRSLVKRNYSISCGPNDEYYRISVKREAAGQGGSLYFHDHANVGSEIEVTPPAGDFFLPEEPNAPVVLVSGGVGLTPMVSMLEAIAKDYPDLEAHFIHGALNSNTHAMDKHVRSLASAHDRVTVKTFYSNPAANDAAGLSHDHDGFITVDWLRSQTPFETSHFYLCGPKSFLRALVPALSKAGVSPDRVHFEFFGPADELLVA